MMKKVLVIATFSAAVVLTVAVLRGLLLPRHASQAERDWGTGYETQVGYMQPDHSYLYYWMLRNALWSNPQPTYHIYVPPVEYPRTYRPWHPPPTVVKPRVDTRTSVPTTSSPRSTSGFTSKPAQPSPRSTSGFTPKPTPAPTARPSASLRSSSGFKPSSSPRSSSGFKSSGKKR